MALTVACACAVAGAVSAKSTAPAGPVATVATHAGASHPSASRRHGGRARTRCHTHRRHHRRAHRQRCRTLTRTADSTSPRTGKSRAPKTGRSPFRLEHPGRHPRGTHAKGAIHTGQAGAVPTTTSSAAAAQATIASVLATPCQNTEAMPEAGNVEQAETSTMCLINQERAREGELPLVANGMLAQAAAAHTNDMVTGDYFAHVSMGGETPLERVERSGYIPNSSVGYTVGENLAWGTLYLATPRSIVAAWMASPEHRANILNGEYRDSAIAIAPSAPPSLADGQPGATYTQEFGVIQG
jgi:uncharacterized protein YkwD